MDQVNCFRFTHVYINILINVIGELSVGIMSTEKGNEHITEEKLGTLETKQKEFVSRKHLRLDLVK